MKHFKTILCLFAASVFSISMIGCNGCQTNDTNETVQDISYPVDDEIAEINQSSEIKYQIIDTTLIQSFSNDTQAILMKYDMNQYMQYVNGGGFDFKVKLRNSITSNYDDQQIEICFNGYNLKEINTYDDLMNFINEENLQIKTALTQDNHYLSCQKEDFSYEFLFSFKNPTESDQAGIQDFVIDHVIIDKNIITDKNRLTINGAYDSTLLNTNYLTIPSEIGIDHYSNYDFDYESFMYAWTLPKSNDNDSNQGSLYVYFKDNWNISRVMFYKL